LLALDPLAVVNGSRCVLIFAVALHDVFFPVAIIIFSTELSRGRVATTDSRECDLAMTVLDLVAMRKFPISYE
jgi:hypothetical protein